MVHEQLGPMFKDQKLLEILGKILDSYETGLNVPAALAAGCISRKTLGRQPKHPAAKAAGTGRSHDCATKMSPLRGFYKMFKNEDIQNSR